MSAQYFCFIRMLRARVKRQERYERADNKPKIFKAIFKCAEMLFWVSVTFRVRRSVMLPAQKFSLFSLQKKTFLCHAP